MLEGAQPRRGKLVIVRINSSGFNSCATAARLQDKNKEMILDDKKY